MKEIEKQPLEYSLPIEVKPDEQLFIFNGFSIENSILCYEITYDGSDRLRRMILQSRIDDSHSYKYINHLLWTGEPHYVNELTEYDNNLYDPKQIGLWHKMLNLEQISTFASLVNEMIKEKGLENISQDDIFSNEDVRNILGLDLDGPFDYTPVKKSNLEPEFA